MKKIIFIFLCGTCFLIRLPAQKPYFQQEVNYKISVTLDDVKHELRAFETIEYINQSPDTLGFIYFHLWPNAYKNNTTAYAKQEVENGSSSFYYSKEAERGYIDSLDFTINGQKADFIILPDSIDIGKLSLKNPLLPGEKIIIRTPFHVKIPGDFSRFGHVGQSYQITQWYPKPAVYDRDGWHPLCYVDQGEFFSEFGSFEVEISIPENYVVATSGELLDKQEIKWLTNKAVKTSSIESFVNDFSFPDSKRDYKTLHFAEKNIHDFAWFADKRYHVLLDSVKLPGTEKWVKTWTMFTNKGSEQWKNSQEYIRDAIHYYSTWFGNYPYNSCTAVQGAISAGGAMEYPKITVVGPSPTDFLLEQMIMHEVGHNWFYGIFGFNERRYPFLDEGFNSFGENRYFVTKYNNSGRMYEFFMPLKIAEIINLDSFSLSQFYESAAINAARFHTDQPMNLSAGDFRYMNYFSIVYEKSSVAFYYLMNYLGEAKFDSIMHVFYNQWKFKHPSPDDLRNAFEKGTDKDLSWFFDDIIKTTGKVDYKIKKIEYNNLIIKNLGDINSPVSLTGYKDSEKQFTFWTEGFTASKRIEIPSNNISKIVINEHTMPEYYRKNNILKTKGFFKKAEPLHIKMFQIMEVPEKTSLGVFPVIGANYYNKTMVGLLFYNPVFPMQKLDFQVMPMFAFGNRDLAGMGKITLHTFPFRSVFERVDFGISARQFAFETGNDGGSYQKIRPELTILIKKKYPRSLISQKICLSYAHIKDFRRSEKTFSTLRYELEKKTVINPYQLDFNLESSDGYLKSFANLNYSITTKLAEKTLQIRLFGGYFLKNDNYFPFHLSATSGSDDYQYDQLYFARFEQVGSGTLWANQIYEKEGGFTSLCPYNSDNWLLSINVKLKVPKIPLKVYFTTGTYEGAGKDYEGMLPVIYQTQKIAYETGLNLSIGEFLNVYFPVNVSRDIQSYLDDSTENYWQKVRFSLNLNVINPFLVRDLLK